MEREKKKKKDNIERMKRWKMAIKQKKIENKERENGIVSECVNSVRYLCKWN